MERVKDESREEEELKEEEEVMEDHGDEDDDDDDDDEDDDEEGLNEEDDGAAGDDGEEDGAPQCPGEQLQAASPSTEQQKKKSAASDRKCVPGIVYLGYIPPRLRPRHVRNLLASHGEIGRIFLQPEGHVVRRRKRKAGLKGKGYTEGWVEFRDKRVAKRVAASLNNTPMGAKKHARFHSDLWSVKYLHRFHWTHLSERLAYEQTVLQQRLRTEVSQAKRESNFYLNSVDKSKHMDKKARKGLKGPDKQWQFSQRQTEDEIQSRKKKKKNQHPAQSSQREKSHRHQAKSQSNVSLLAKIFNSGQSQD